MAIKLADVAIRGSTSLNVTSTDWLRRICVTKKYSKRTKYLLHGFFKCYELPGTFLDFHLKRVGKIHAFVVVETKRAKIKFVYYIGGEKDLKQGGLSGILMRAQ